MRLLKSRTVESTCQMLVVMKEGSRRRCLPDVSGEEGRWRQGTSLVLAAFEEKDRREYLPNVNGDEGRW